LYSSVFGFIVTRNMKSFVDQGPKTSERGEKREIKNEKGSMRTSYLNELLNEESFALIRRSLSRTHTHTCSVCVKHQLLVKESQ